MKVIPLLALPIDRVQTYWQTLYMNDTLKYRLADVNNPDWQDVLGMITRMGRGMWCLVEGIDEVRGEFMLENRTGRAAQVHFSMHPDNDTAYSLAITEQALQTIFSSMDVETLYGLTPTMNRVACLYIRKVGFKKIGILPKGINYMGRISDAVISVRTV